VRIGGTFPIDDFNEQFGTDLPIEDYHTVAGFVFGLIGRAPEGGDEVEHDGVCFRVLHVEGSRIEKLEVEFIRPTIDERQEAEQRAAAEG
jgi:putative hemolysin